MYKTQTIEVNPRIKQLDISICDDNEIWINQYGHDEKLESSIRIHYSIVSRFVEVLQEIAKTAKENGKRIM